MERSGLSMESQLENACQTNGQNVDGNEPQPHQDARYVATSIRTTGASSKKNYFRIFVGSFSDWVLGHVFLLQFSERFDRFRTIDPTFQPLCWLQTQMISDVFLWPKEKFSTRYQTLEANIMFVKFLGGDDQAVNFFPVNRNR